MLTSRLPIIVLNFKIHNNVTEIQGIPGVASGVLLALSRLGAELELRRSGSSLGACQAPLSMGFSCWVFFIPY